MSYVKKTWASGDTITSAALNNIENGVEANETAAASAASSAAAATPVHVPFTLTSGAGGVDGTTTATFAEVAADVLAGKTVIAEAVVNESVVAYLPCTIHTPVSSPTVLLFAGVAYIDFGSGTAKSTLVQISLSSSETVGVVVEDLT